MRPLIVPNKAVSIIAGSALLAMALVPAASAQDGDRTDPDLGSGWVVRASADLEDSPWLTDDEWPGALAGTPRVGFVVIHDEDGLYSRDGNSWESFSLDVPSDEEIHVVDAAANSRGFVAISGGGADRVPFVWHSADGRSWDRVDPDDLPAPATPSIPDGGISEVVAGPGGFVIIGVSRCEVFAWFSTDGRNWTESSLPEGCGEVSIAPGRGTRWVAVARIEADIVVLGSADGRTWTAVDGDMPKDTHSPHTALAVRGDTLVLAGGSWDPVMTTVTPAIWVSRDGGASWAETTFGDELDDDTGLALFPLTVNDLGFVGSFYLETRQGLVPGSLVFSPDGSSWREIPADDVFFEFAASQDSIIATTSSGILSWTPPGSELARTGSGDTAARLLFASALVVFGVALLSMRRLTLRGPAGHESG